MFSFCDCDDIFRNYDRVSSKLGPGWSFIPDNRTACVFALVTRTNDARGVAIAATIRLEYDADFKVWSFAKKSTDGPDHCFSMKGNVTLEDLVVALKGSCGKKKQPGVNDKADAPSERLLTNSADQYLHSERASQTSADLTDFEIDLSNSDIRRFSRQLILPEIGVPGQVALRNGSVLVVGAGGLGCPAGVFLAAAGVGRIGVVDYDVVEISNLHRQIAHSEENVDVPKAKSLAQACRRLNSTCNAVAIQTQISSANAMELVSDYDIVLDCTDNVASRYLLNDACVLTGKPLVSGSALRWEGQLTVYNFASGPCYRCIFPNPPPPETVTNCSDGGVIGVVPGIVGSMQALEAIKMLCGAGSICSQRLLLFDGLDCSFRKMKLRNRKEDCRVCGCHPDIRQLIDYELFCGSAASDKDFSLSLLSASDRVSVADYRDVLASNEPHLVIDVRTCVETDICRLPTSSETVWWNLPIEELKSRTSQIAAKEALLKELVDVKLASRRKAPIFVVCRRGNDSQIAVALLKNLIESVDGVPDRNTADVRDVAGGLHAWARRIDSNFPVY